MSSPREDSKDLGGFRFTFEHILTPGSTSIISADPNARDEVSDSESLSDSIREYHKENGRTYHSYKKGSYDFPNDAEELWRLEVQHKAIQMAMGDRNYFTPWSQANPPRRVLDVATGTGTWAVEMGDEFPEAIIYGTDLSEIQVKEVPEGVYFFIEDSSQPWGFKHKFDYVHLRVTLGCWGDFKKEIAQQALDNLEPGGWIEAQELLTTLFCDDGTMPDDFAPKVWFEQMNYAADIKHRPLTSAPMYKKWLEEVGFVDVQEKVLKLPVNNWPRDRKMKELGYMWSENFNGGYEAFSLAHFTRTLHWTRDQVLIYLMDVRRGLRNTNVHAYQKFYVVIGRKPYPGEVRLREPPAQPSPPEDLEA